MKTKMTTAKAGLERPRLFRDARAMSEKKSFVCPCCDEEIPTSVLASYLASITTEAKVQAARKNGKKGGRPKGSKDKQPRKRRKV